MKRKNRIIILAAFAILLLSSCASEATLAVTPTLTFTSTLAPTFTPTNTITPTPTQIPTITPTPTPISGCSPRATVQGEANRNLPGFIDLISVSTSLTTIKVTNKNYLVVIFTVREIPDTIIVNPNHINDGRYYIEWGVAIDEDNDPTTGQRVIFGSKSDSGYETVLSASSYKQGPEGDGSIQSFFANKVNVFKTRRGGVGWHF